MSTLREKIISVRAQEGLSQQEFCRITGAGLSAIKALEAGRSDQLNTKTLFAITNHPQFKKYAVYLVCDDDDAKAGQEMPRTELDDAVDTLRSMREEEVGQVMEYLRFLLAKRSQDV